MRILQISEHFPPELGGLANHVANLSRALATDHDVAVVTANQHADLDACFEADVPVTRAPLRWLSAPYLRSPGLLRKIPAEMRRFTPDIIHLHSFQLAHTDMTVRLARRRGIPVVVTVHAFGDQVTRLRRFLSRVHIRTLGRRTLEIADRVITLDPIAEDWIRRVSRGRARTAVIPNGIWIKEFSEPAPRAEVADKIPSDGRFILFVGRHHHVKGLDRLLHTAETLEERGVSLVIAGSGPLTPWLESQVSTGSNENVYLVGRTTTSDLRWLYQNAEALVVPSRFEGLPTVILEAMAARCPVVATPVGGVPSLVIDSKTGILVGGSPESIIEGIDRLEETPFRRSIIDNARTHVTSYDWSAIASKMATLYRTLSHED